MTYENMWTEKYLIYNEIHLLEIIRKHKKPVTLI